MDEEARKARAEARRRTATIARASFGEESVDQERPRGPAALSLLTRLTLVAWSLQGALPSYTRAETPYRFVRTERG